MHIAIVVYAIAAVEKVFRTIFSKPVKWIGVTNVALIILSIWIWRLEEKYRYNDTFTIIMGKP